MNLQRWVLLFSTALAATLLYAVQTNAFPKWTVALGVVAYFFTNVIQAFTNAVQIPKDNPAAKVSTSVRPPPLPLLLLAFFVALAVLGNARSSGVPLPVVPELVACGPNQGGAVSPGVTQGILDAEQIACVGIAAIAGASEPAEVKALCPSLPALTEDVVAVINSFLGATKHQMSLLPPDGLDGAKTKLRTLRLQKKDGGAP
jgi:hypothetical protein